MKLNNYSTYIKKDWKTNKGRLVNEQNDPTKFNLPIDEVNIQLMNYFAKIKRVVNKEYENIHNYNFYNAELK